MLKTIVVTRKRVFIVLALLVIALLPLFSLIGATAGLFK